MFILSFDLSKSTHDSIHVICFEVDPFPPFSSQEDRSFPHKPTGKEDIFFSPQRYRSAFPSISSDTLSSGLWEFHNLKCL